MVAMAALVDALRPVLGISETAVYVIAVPVGLITVVGCLLYLEGINPMAGMAILLPRRKQAMREIALGRTLTPRPVEGIVQGSLILPASLLAYMETDTLRAEYQQAYFPYAWTRPHVDSGRGIQSRYIVKYRLESERLSIENRFQPADTSVTYEQIV
jgi:hypothetical protein